MKIIESFFRFVGGLFIVGLLLIYVVLGGAIQIVLYNPLSLCFAVPFGMIGAMIGLLLANAHA